MKGMMMIMGYVKWLWGDDGAFGWCMGMITGCVRGVWDEGV